MNCPTITVHVGKCYKALIDSGATISLLRYSTYKKIKDCYKTPIQPTTAKLNTADGSPMSALGMTALHLRIIEFKFTHYFIICNQLPKTELTFGINIQRKFSISYAWDKEKNCCIQKEGKLLTYKKNCEQNATIGTVKLTLKITPQHNGVVPIKISGPIIKEQMAYFITDNNTIKGRNQNINIINGIHRIKGRTSVNILVSNYTNKHLTFNKQEYVGYLELSITDDTTINQTEAHQTNSITLQKMMAEQVQPDVFNPPCHKLTTNIQNELDTLQKEYELQFAKDEMSIRTTPLTSMMIDTGNSDPVSQKPYPITMKHYQWVKEEIEKLLKAKVICSSRSSWSAPIIIVPKGDGGKHLVINYRALNKVTRKFTWPMPKVEDIFSKLNGATYFTTLDLRAGYHHILLDKPSIPKTAFNSPFRKYEYVKVPFGLAQFGLAYFQDLMTGILKDFNFVIAYLDNIIIIQHDSTRASFTHWEGIHETMVSQTLHKDEQMQLLFQGNPVFRTHFKCHRDLTPTIPDTCHTAYTTTHYTQTSSSVPWTSWLLQKIYKRFCQNSTAINTTYTPTGKI